MTVPYAFGAATSAIPLSQLDDNFNTTITLGNTAIQLGNTVTTLNNMTLANVNISSGNVTITNVSVTTVNASTVNTTTLVATTANVTTINATDVNVAANVTLNAGTVNGVAYLNGSKVLTTGSAMTFDGTTFQYTGAANFATSSGNVGIGTSSPSQKLDVLGGIAVRASTSGANQDVIALRALNSDNTAYANAIYYANSHRWAYAGATEGMRLDSSGNLGLGVTPSAFASAQKAFQVLNGSLYADASSAGLQYNSFYNGTNERYIANGYATSYYQASGQHIWRTAPSGTAGNAISFTQALTLDADRNLLLNGTSAGASSVGTFAIFNGTAPTGSVTDGIILYAEDVSSSSELKVRDEAGNVTTLSPHNFSLIPEGPSEDMAWAYYSEKGGKRINVDMLKLARMVEKLTGEKLVYES